MKVIDLNQSTSEWLAWRRSGVTATDMCVLAGSYPFEKTKRDVWKEKCGQSVVVQENPAMRHGKKWEGHIRYHLEIKHNLTLEPLCVEGRSPHYLASLDGFDQKSKLLFEFKAPYSETVLDRIYHLGNLPQYWIDQVHWQASIVEPKKAFLSVYDWVREKTFTFPVELNENKYHAFRHLADEFWEYVIKGVEPDAEKGDYDLIESPGLHNLLRSYQILSENGKYVERAKKDLKKEIESYGNNRSFECMGFKVCKLQPPPSYDFDKMKDDGIELDKYKKQPKGDGYYKILIPKI